MSLSREQIVDKMGISSLSEEEQDKLLQQLADTVNTRILLKLTEKLSDTELDELERIMDADNVKGFDDFLGSKVPDYEAWTAQIEEDTINELENNRIAIEDEVEAQELTQAPTD